MGYTGGILQERYYQLSGTVGGTPPAPASVAPAAPAPASGDGCNPNYPGRVQFTQILGPTPQPNFNPFADSAIVRPGYYWYVLNALISIIGNNTALGEYHLFLVSPQLATLAGNPLVVPAAGNPVSTFLGLLKLTGNYAKEDVNSAYPVSVDERFIVPSGCFLKASLLSTAPGAGITAWKMQLSLAYIELANSEPIPNF